MYQKNFLKGQMFPFPFSNIAFLTKEPSSSVSVTHTQHPKQEVVSEYQKLFFSSTIHLPNYNEKYETPPQAIQICENLPPHPTLMEDLPGAQENRYVFGDICRPPPDRAEGQRPADSTEGAVQASTKLNSHGVLCINPSHSPSFPVCLTPHRQESIHTEKGGFIKISN